MSSNSENRGGRVGHIIDCSASAFIPYPDEWIILESDQIASRITAAHLVWNINNIDFVMTKKQKDGPVLVEQIYKDLMGQRVLPAHVLDYLLANSFLLPKRCEFQYTYFWGTIYHHRINNGRLVRYLYSFNGEWKWDYANFVLQCSGVMPAAILKVE